MSIYTRTDVKYVVHNLFRVKCITFKLNCSDKYFLSSLIPRLKQFTPILFSVYMYNELFAKVQNTSVYSVDCVVANCLLIFIYENKLAQAKT